MVPPLNVYRMVVDQRVHNFIGVRPAVIDISDHMKMVNYKALGCISKADNELIRLAQGDNLLIYFLIIRIFIVRQIRLV
ncbi:hypothetical protein D3C81_1237620 [compost metagenome]